MKIIEANEGKKISYTVSGRKIYFNDEMMLNLEKYQNEDQVHIDICYDTLGNLTNHVAQDGRYVAQIVIPGFEYEETQATALEETETSENGENPPYTERTKLPLDMKKVEMTLYTVE